MRLRPARARYGAREQEVENRNRPLALGVILGLWLIAPALGVTFRQGAQGYRGRYRGGYFGGYRVFLSH